MSGSAMSAEEAFAELEVVRAYLRAAHGADRTSASLRRLGLLDLLLEESDDGALLDEAIATARALGDAELEAETASLVDITLAVNLTERFRRRGDRADLEEALAKGRARVRSGAEESWLTDRANLAATLLVSWTYTSRAGHLDEVIELLEPVIDDLLDPEPPSTGQLDDDQSKIVHNLANAHSQRYDLRRNPADQHRAIELYRVALPGAAPGTRAGIASALARQLTDAYRSGTAPQVAVLDEAVELARAAIGQAGIWHRRAQRWSALAFILLVRFEAGGPESDLEEAEALVERMLDGPDTSPDWADHLGTASAVAFATYRHRRRREDLERAITLASTALDRDGLDHQTIGVLTNQLVLSLTERFELDGDRTDLDRAIGRGRAALVTGLRSDVELTISTNLSNALHTRFDVDGDPADLLEAIATLMPALQRTKPSTERADRLSAAGMLYSAKAETVGGGVADLDRAVAFGREALTLVPSPSPDRVVFLANTGRWLSERSQATGERPDLEAAITLLEEAHELVGEDAAIRAKIAFSLGSVYRLRYDRFTHPSGTADLQRACDLWDEALALDEPFIAVYAGQELGNVAFAFGQWTQCELALSHALAAARTLTGRRTLVADRERARFNVQGTAAVAALAAVRAGDVRAAAVHLEQSSATLLAEAYGQAAVEVGFDQIMAAVVALGGPVVYLATTPAGGMALIVTADGEVRPVELPVTSADVERELDGLRTSLSTSAGLEEWQAAARRLLDYTWRSTVEPVADQVEPSSAVGLVPVGRLAWLPVTTAGAATGRALFQTTVPHLWPYARSIVAAPPWPFRPSAFVAADALEGERCLPSVAREAGLVGGCYRHATVSIVDRFALAAPPTTRPLRASGAPSEVAGREDAGRLRHGLALADVGHLACHLDLDLRDPLSSVVRFGAGVRLADLVEDRLPRSTHLVLSACDSGLTGTRLPDEAIGPATALLAAGARSVVAALWPVDDELAPDFMVEYHRRLGRGEDPATALALTQRAAAQTQLPVVWPAFVHIGP